MKFRVKGNIRDMIAFLRLVPQRKRKIAAAPATPKTKGYINGLAEALHPQQMFLVINEVREESPTTRTFRLSPEPGSPTERLAFFKAGQYLSVRGKIGRSFAARPYSISSSPLDALRNHFYEITVRKKDSGFFTGHIWENWRAGTRVETSGPEGFFFIDPIRDSREVLALAGGCGVTPFRSMMRDIMQTGADRRFTLLYGITNSKEALFREEFARMEKESAGRIAVRYVLSEPDPAWKEETGFLTAETIRRLSGGVEGKSVFICGPRAMYDFLDKELQNLSVPRRRIRREAFGESGDVTARKDFPAEAAGKSFTLTVRLGPEKHTLPAKSSESLLAAMERAGIKAPSRCRSGECGFCRSLLIRGEVFIIPDSDGRRAADRDYGFIHPCASYPLGDVELKVPREG